ncbi:MAG: protein translocase subunit SecF [Negativicutes bacterium]|nr:protein translocase subunit SecF [Negativicutes bacterium]
MKFSIIAHRNWFFAFSLLLILVSLASLATQGLNLGIDFTGGTLIDLKFAKPVSVAEVRDVLKDYKLENSVVQLAATEKTDAAPNVLIRTHVLSEAERKSVLEGFTAKLGKFDIMRIEKVGATIGSELTREAIIALLLSWLMMIAYISYRFEFRFGVAGILSLVHDVLIVLGVFSILRKEIDASFVAALLTIVGYSINDTIVIFDRIRENLKAMKKGETLPEMVDRSIWQTMTRSIYTVLTVLFATGSLYFLGGETTKNFSLALLIGFVSGTYSSIFNASPIWVLWKQRDERKRLEHKMKPA